MFMAPISTEKKTCRREYFGRSPEFFTAKAIPFIDSFSGNSAASGPIFTFMCLWAIYVFPGSVHIFPPAEKADPSWEYIIGSQTHECGNWDWGPDIPFLGIFVSNFRHFVFAVFDNVLFRELADEEIFAVLVCCITTAKEELLGIRMLQNSNLEKTDVEYCY